MSKIRFLFSASLTFGLIASVLPSANASEVEKSVSVSGHVNRAVVVSDNGESTTIGQIDNSSVSGSRFRVVSSAKSAAMTIGATIELGVQGDGSASTHNDTSTTSISLRHSFVSASNSMGTLSFGHTGAADNDLTSMKLNGTSEAGFYDDSVIAGEELHVSGNTGTAGSGVTVSDILVDSISSRSSVVKYQTPTMGGFTGIVGYSHQDHGSARLTYAADYDGTNVRATGGWGSRGAASINSVWGGSMAVSLANGLNGSLAYSQRNLNGKVTANTGISDPEMIGASLGYTMGANGITAWYQQVNDLASTTDAANGNEAESYALVFQHNMTDYGTAIYGGIQNVEYKTSTTNYDDITAGWVGIKVTF